MLPHQLVQLSLLSRHHHQLLVQVVVHHLLVQLQCPPPRRDGPRRSSREGGIAAAQPDDGEHSSNGLPLPHHNYIVMHHHLICLMPLQLPHHSNIELNLLYFTPSRTSLPLGSPSGLDHFKSRRRAEVAEGVACRYMRYERPTWIVVYVFHRHSYPHHH